MPRHYVYRMDHDLGFAPHVSRGICTVCGCKKTTIERWATKGSWVVGIGGNGTGRPNRLIYAMQVDETPSYSAFLARSPKRAAYLAPHQIGEDAPVLVSRTNYFYFGNRALAIPRELTHIVPKTQGCKRLTELDVGALLRLVLSQWKPGTHGVPNNGVAGAGCHSGLTLRCRGR
jgi:hypothetical protein